VTDTSGKTYTVQKLTAKYTAEGAWLGGRPEESDTVLHIRLFITKDRISTQDYAGVAFRNVHRIFFRSFKGSAIPVELKQALGCADGDAPIRVERRDGSVLLLGPRALVEMDPAGNQSKRIDINEFSLSAREEQGQRISLDGFCGRAKDEAGNLGDFWIPINETTSIEFE
jgi:hypothetical protein